MATIAISQQTHRPTRFPWAGPLLIALAVVAGFNFIATRAENAALDGVYLATVTVDRTTSHAYQEHKEGAVRAWNCFDNIGHSFMMYNWFRGNWIKVCQDETKQVYFQIVRRIRGVVSESTAYPKDGVFDLEIAAKILLDQGATPTWVRAGLASLRWLAEMITR